MRIRRTTYAHTTHRQYPALPRLRRADGHSRMEMGVRQVQAVFPAELHYHHPGRVSHRGLRQAKVLQPAPLS
jgi:hypothetical protein